MKHYLLKINDLIANKKLDKEHIAVKIGVKRATFYNYLNNSTKMPVDVLLELSNFLELPASYFLGEKVPESNYSNNKLSNSKVNINSSIEEGDNKYLKIEIEYLKKQIKDKEEIINLLKNK